MNLENVIEKVAHQNRAAFDDLYERTSAKLFGVVLRILKDRSEAQEVTQEVFMKIWHSAGRFNASSAAPMPWLIAIARNQAIDRYRRSKSHLNDHVDDLPLVSRELNPEENASASSTKSSLDLCLSELIDDHNQMIRLAYLEGYSYQELADRFSQPLNSVRTWLRRGLLSLRSCMERQEGAY